MRRSVVLIGFALALALAFATAGSTASGSPVLRSVTASHGHLVVKFTLAQDLIPGRVLAATSRASLSRLVPGSAVKLREAMQTSPDPATGIARWRTHKALPPGTYYVEVSGIQSVGVTDCMRWSNSLRVVIP